MELRRELQLGIGALVAFHLLVSFGAISLLSRMSPAIERILEDNVYSIEAAERMLAVLALTGRQPATALQRETFLQSLRDARRNITERDETVAIETVEENWERALEGDLDAVRGTVAALRNIVTINRQAMRRADAEANRLGAAGAWAVAFLAFGGFSVSLLVLSRTRKRIVQPLLELYSTLESARRGDRYRRCQVLEAPVEIKRALEAVNGLLEERESHALEEASGEDRRARATALHLLEDRPEPTFVIDAGGELVLANERGLALLSSGDGVKIRDALRRVPSRKAPDMVRATAIARDELWLCTIPQDGDQEAA